MVSDCYCLQAALYSETTSKVKLLIKDNVFLVLNQFLTPSEALKSRGGYGKYGKGDKDASQPKTLAGTSSGLPSQNSTRRGLGISAWGLVALIVGLIVAVMGLYYFSVCYPMCQSRSTSHKYDKMSLPTMA